MYNSLLVQMLLFADYIIMCTEKKEDMEGNLAEMSVKGEMGDEYALGKNKSNDGKPDR